MCNCIQQQTESLKKKICDCLAIEEGQYSNRIILGVRYFPRTKEGRHYKHARYESLYPKYCPFCGQPYNDGKTNQN